MSEIGTDRSQRIITSEFTIPVQKFEFDRPVPIINGKIRLYAKQFGCILEIPVRQVKTRHGAYYSTKFKKPTKSHYEIITYLLNDYPKHGAYAFKSEKLAKYLNKWLRKHKKKPRSTYGIIGRCSELASQRVLIPVEHSQYRLNFERAVQVLNEEAF